MGAPRRSGLQAEVLASLAVVMVLASVVLGVVVVRMGVTHHETREARLRAHLTRSLAVAVRDLDRAATLLGVDAAIWTVSPGGSVQQRGVRIEPIDPESLALAAEAREAGSTLFRFGPADAPIRFAAPLDPGGQIAVVRLPLAEASEPSAASGVVLVGVLIANAAIFTLLGVVLLRRRVISPLMRLAGAARSVAAGGFDARIPVEGTREMVEVGTVFNEMTEALARRTGALEKAVADLRDTNRSLRRARAGLDRAERLASVGSLAAGVAHEVGNPMGALLAFLDLIERDPGLREESRRHLAQAREQGGRVRHILRQLLDFSSPPRAALEPVDLAELAEQTAALVRAQRRYADVAIEVVCEGAPERAQAESAVVAQILLNLVLNAADAVRGADSPRVALRVRAAPLELRREEADAGAAEREVFDAVECTISDNGPGIPPEIRERVFDPFFTTKSPGEGTGLGLANALRLAEELGGRLELVEPAAGEGAVFALRLPIAAGEAAMQRQRSGGRTRSGRVPR